MENVKCHDCSRDLERDEEYMEYSSDIADFVKCRKCHEEDPLLRDYQPAECYSRVVGYYRPVEQFNAGKKAEFADRVDFKVQ